MKDRLFDIWFSIRLGFANTEFQTVLDRLGTPYDVFNADEAEIDALPCSARVKAALMNKSLQDCTIVEEYCRKNNVGILFWQDDDYPVSLRSLRDPPLLLYYIGRLPDLNRRLCLGVVGTRRMSEYGKRIAYKLGYELAAAGTVVVSGLALGNDSAAAVGTIVAGGDTVAVLACGIDTVYPRAHTTLHEAIVRSGAVMTEYPPFTPPGRHRFPARNRIISGLSQGTIVVEGDVHSGSLITARMAIMQGRDIYAFPGNVGEINAAGTNYLIVEGAAAVRCARDVLEYYTLQYGDVMDMKALSIAEGQVHRIDEALGRYGVSSRSESGKVVSFSDTVRAETTSAKTDALPAAEASSARPAPPRGGRGSSRTGQASARSESTIAPCAPTETAAVSHAVSSLPTDASPCAGKSGAGAARRTKEPKRTARGSSGSTGDSPIGDASRRAIESLTPTQSAIFHALPLDGTISPDDLAREGFTVSEIMASVTVLEIKGLVLTMPGGLIGRK